MSEMKKRSRMSMEEYRDKLHEYREDFLECKDVRHHWQVTEPYHNVDRKHVVRVLRCSRCGAERTDNYAVVSSGRLARMGSTYRYPQGFAMRGLPQAERLSEVVRYESYLRTVKNNAEKGK
jgi:hypothetical protein